MCVKVPPKFPPLGTPIVSRPARDPASAFATNDIGFAGGGAPSVNETPALVRGPSPRVRAALDAIESVLVEFDRDAKDLWAILTALRGPDSNSWYTKDRATVRVRSAAFPKLAGRYGPASSRLADFGSGGPLNLSLATKRSREEVFYRAPSAGEHFENHIAEAVHALTRVIG